MILYVNSGEQFSLFYVDCYGQVSLLYSKCWDSYLYAVSGQQQNIFIDVDSGEQSHYFILIKQDKFLLFMLTHMSIFHFFLCRFTYVIVTIFC